MFLPHAQFTTSPPPPQEKMEEQRKIRRLQMMMDMVMSVISQDGSLTVDQAAELVADSKKAALAMFPDKELPTTSSTSPGCNG